MSGAAGQRGQTSNVPAPHQADLELSGGTEFAVGVVAVPPTSLDVSPSKAPALTRALVDGPGGRSCRASSWSSPSAEPG